ncbi:hypothetical protein PR202_ga21132 [Eleusine coracana subsp. coracana]|uniref:Uncharacterized protein n=1 Tax=Eleusine coracana subsp. coracana TaxID=191504 RepID=A0AAV5CZW1_ELECO|nr:hypothetical protein PR202_ga21132 [Eleusine coracana subsp. coracana]
MSHGDRLLPKEWIKSYIIPLFVLGLSCSMESTKDRPGMQDVCAKLCGIKEAYLEFIKH